LIKTTPFYQTTNNAQSKYYWGDRALQTGDTFNPSAWNNVPNAPAQAWGLQNFGAGPSINDLMSIMQGNAPLQPNTMGQPVAPRLTPQEQAYIATLDPMSAQVYLRNKGLA
jgi:hypothetical protein